MMPKEKIKKKIEITESEIEFINSLPPDRKLSRIKKELKSRLETLKEMEEDF